MNTPVFHVKLEVEGITAAIGPVGDSLQVPMRITGGVVAAFGAVKTVLCGTDFARMDPDERLFHEGNVAVGNPSGDVLLWYDGISLAREGAYDEVLDGRLPGKIPSTLCVRLVSTAPDWRRFSRRLLFGVGSFDGDAGVLEFTVLLLTESDDPEPA